LDLIGFSGRSLCEGYVMLKTGDPELSTRTEIRLGLKAARAAGLKTLLGILWHHRRDQDSDYYQYEEGHYSAEENRKAALQALHLPQDWKFSEADLARARADRPSDTLAAIQFLIDYHYRPAYVQELERALNYTPAPPSPDSDYGRAMNTLREMGVEITDPERRSSRR
jgi:hypothetical protein